MAVLKTIHAVGSTLAKPIYKDERLLLSPGRIISEKDVQGLLRYGIEEVVNGVPENLKNDIWGRGLLESERGILKHNFNETYSASVRDAIRQELLQDVRDNEGRVTDKILTEITTEYKELCIQHNQSLIDLKEFLKVLADGKIIRLSSLGKSIDKELENRFRFALSPENSSFPDPLVEVIALKQLQGDQTYLRGLDAAHEAGMLALRLNANHKSKNIPIIYHVEHAMLAGLLKDCGYLTKEIEGLAYSGKKFTQEEREKIRIHTIKGQDIVGSYQFLPEPIARAVGEHHEKSKGNGYPNKKKGNQIHPLSGLIITIDKLSGLSRKAPYKKQRSKIKLLELLAKESDGSFSNFFNKYWVVGSDYTYQQIANDPTYAPLATLVKIKKLDQCLDCLNPNSG